MTDFRLKVFSSVARNLSFTKASHELHISQPAISKHIQELEQEYNTQLFIRQNNRVELTPAGKLLLAHVEKILGAYRSLHFDMSLLATLPEGRVRVGASTTIAHYILPALMADFSQKFANVKLSLISGDSDNIEQALQEGRIDLGLVECNTHNATLRYTPFLCDELVVATSTRSKWAHLSDITTAELAQLPLVLHNNSADSLQLITHSLERLSISIDNLNVVAMFDSIESVKSYIPHAQALAILPLAAIQRELSSGELKVIALRDISLKRELCFVRNIHETPTAVKNFIAYIEANI